MDLIPDASVLHKLGSYCFREVCTFLTTEELLDLWSTNDRRLHALLHRCDAFGLLKLQQNSSSSLGRALSWMKTLAKPRAKHLDLDLASLPPSGVFIRRLLHNCTFESVDVANYSEDYYANTLKKWSELSPTDNNASPNFPLLLHGTVTLSLHSHYAQPSAPFPSTVTDLTVPGHWLADLPPTLNITALTLKQSTGRTLLKLTNEDSLGPAPILLHGLATTLPNLTKLDLFCGYDTDMLPIFEVPPNLTHLKIDVPHYTLTPIFIWPHSSLHHLEVTTSPNYISDSPFAPLARLAYCINFYSLKHFFPDLVYLKLSTTAQDTGTDPIASWSSMVAHIGKPMADRLLPPGYTSERLFHLSKETSLYDTPFAASVVYTLPPLVTSLDLTVGSITDFRELLTALNHSSTSKSVSSLHVTLCTLVTATLEFNDPIRLPSNITNLTVEGFPLTCEFLSAALPTSLTRLEATFTNVESIIAVREQFGPSIEIISPVNPTVDVSAIHLSQFYITSTTTQHTSTTGKGSTSEATNDSSASKPTLPPTSPHDTGTLPRLGPYGAWDVCDANGNWTVTIPGLRNALAQLVGHRTTLSLSISSDTEWPPSVTRFDKTDSDELTFSSGVLFVSLDLISSKGLLHSNNGYLPDELTSSLASISSSISNRDLDFAAIASLPRLTELSLPQTDFNLYEISLPICIRTLSIGIRPHVQDFKLRNILKHLLFLERADFDATGIIFTAPNWPSSSLTLVDLESWLESYLRPNGNTKITFRSMEEIPVAVQLLPQTLTSLDLLRSAAKATNPILPPKLTRYHDYLKVKAPLPLETLPSLTDASLHIAHQYYNYDFEFNLPKCLQSLCITTNDSILADYGGGDEGLFQLSDRILPCVGHLHTLAVPGIYLKPFIANLAQISNDCVLPSLTRLVISGGDCFDAEIHEVLQSNFFKLRRLTLTGYVRFTGQIVTESSTSPVTLESLFRDTRTALLRVLESHERKSMNKQRSNDPSQLERHEKSSQLSHPISAATTSSIEPTSLPSTATDTMSLEVNVLFCATPPDIDDDATKVVIPSDSTHFSLLTGRRSSSPTQIDIDPPTLDTTPTDWLENEVRTAMTDLSPCVNDIFVWSSISNWMDLNRLVDIEYESDEDYEPGDYFQYPSLQRLKIHAPIAEVDDANALKYSVWKVPSSLTHLVVTRAIRSFTFICADDSKDLQLSTLELPQAIWQSEDCVPPSLRKLLVMDCNPRSSSRDLESCGCEIIFN